MKKLLLLALILTTPSVHAVDLSGLGITTTNNGYHLTVKIAVKGITTGKIQVTDSQESCITLGNEYKAAIKALNNSDIKVKTTCAVNKTGKPIGYKVTVPAGIFNS
jgi:hypothetical protein